jgi:transposase
MSTATAPTSAATTADTQHLPDDPALLKAMLAEVLTALQQSQREREQLRTRLDQLLRRLYGPRAERFRPDQPLLFPPENPDALLVPPPTNTPTTPTPAPKTKRHGHGRQQLPKHLPREQRVYDLSAAERACPCCGQSRTVMGKEISEQLDYVPSSLRVIEHVRLTYGCTHCQAPRSTPAAAGEVVTAATPAANESLGLARQESVSTPVVSTAPPEPARVAPTPTSTFTTAPKPRSPVLRGLAAPGLLAYVIVSKFGDHLPLYRLEHIFGRSGVSLRRSTLCDWLADSATLLRPLYQVMVQEVLQSWVIQTDDTPVQVQDKTRDHTRQGRVWDYWGDAYHPYVVYDYTPNHEHVGPQRFLRDYFGYLQADAYTGYDALYATQRLMEVGCWAHARRKFYEARATDPERALYVLGVIRQLYHIERQADERIAAVGLTREVGWWLRLQLRHEQARPLLTTLCHWLEQQREQVLPKSPIGEAIGYALNHWVALVRYTTQGYLAIDNNAAERALRAIAVGRKNYLFFGSDGGGATAAVLYSFVQSCKRLGVEPWRYLRDVLERLPTYPAEQWTDLLPDRWAQVQAAQMRAALPDG